MHPKFDIDGIIQMTPDQIIDSDPKTAKPLDTVRQFTCPDSKDFEEEISQYINSKNTQEFRVYFLLYV